jgi:hypothetical protein
MMMSAWRLNGNSNNALQANKMTKRRIADFLKRRFMVSPLLVSTAGFLNQEIK